MIVGLFALKEKSEKLKNLSNNFPIFCHYETQRKLRFESTVVIVFGERRKKKKKKRRKNFHHIILRFLTKAKSEKNGTKNVDGVIVRGSRELDIRQKKKEPEYSKTSEDDVTVKDLKLEQ